jgi:hypothetical protein
MIEEEDAAKAIVLCHSLDNWIEVVPEWWRVYQAKGLTNIFGWIKESGWRI